MNDQENLELTRPVFNQWADLGFKTETTFSYRKINSYSWTMLCGQKRKKKKKEKILHLLQNPTSHYGNSRDFTQAIWPWDLVCISTLLTLHLTLSFLFLKWARNTPRTVVLVVYPAWNVLSQDIFTAPSSFPSGICRCHLLGVDFPVHCIYTSRHSKTPSPSFIFLPALISTWII